MALNSGIYSARSFLGRGGGGGGKEQNRSTSLMSMKCLDQIAQKQKVWLKKLRKKFRFNSSADMMEIK